MRPVRGRGSRGGRRRAAVVAAGLRGASSTRGWDSEQNRSFRTGRKTAPCSKQPRPSRCHAQRGANPGSGSGGEGETPGVELRSVCERVERQVGHAGRRRAVVHRTSRRWWAGAGGTLAAPCEGARKEKGFASIYGRRRWESTSSKQRTHCRTEEEGAVPRSLHNLSRSRSFMSFC